MTMDNGEGRPLDEAESGQDDPQGWYFDLPGGAWERQEEKNRTLRQRVLGNIQEDAEKAKGDPFGKKFELKPQPEAAFELKRPEPEAKKGRGLFGFAKKQKQSDGAAEIPATRRYDSASPVEHDEDEEWSTEPSLKLSPFPRAESHGTEASWGEPDGGWNLASPATPAGDDAHEAPLETAEEDFATTMRPWAHHADHEDESQDSVAPFSAIESIEAESHDGQLAEIEEEDFATRIRSWAHRDESAKDESTGDDLGAPAWEPAETEADTAPDRETPAFAPVARVEGWDEGEALRSGPASEEEREPANAATAWDLQNDAAEAEAPELMLDEEPEPPQPLVLRPRAHADGEKRLDWNFGPAAWGDSPAGPGEPAAAAYEADIEDSALSSMKKWAQRGREDGHPHFTTVHHETEEIDDDIAPAPIPLRPRHQEDEPQKAARFEPATPTSETSAEPGAPPSIPLVLRSRTEPPAEAPVRDASAGPSKWDDFFNIAPEGEADGETSEAGPTGEGIAAMRAWAQKRAEPEAPEKIPDEFLKPFDWELQEDEPEASSPVAVPAEFLKPFDWEAGESASETDEASPSEAWEEADAEALVPESQAVRAVFESDEPADSTFNFPSEAAPAPEAAGGPFEEDDDPLAGLFEHARAAAPAPAGKKKGRLGRLFGRSKKEEAEQPALLDTDEPGDWILPSEDAEDADVRVVAEKDWDEHGGTFAAPDAQPATSAGWGASRSEGWLSSDSDALDEFATNISASESPAGPEAADPEIAAAGLADEVTTWATAGLAAAEAEDADQADAEFAWGSGATAPAPGVGPDPASAWSAGVIEDLPDDQDTWSPEPVNETPYFARLTASTADWEATEVAPDGLDSAAHDADAWDPVEPEIPVEAVASVDAVVEEPVAGKAWWEQPAAEEVPETPVEAVASVDAVVEEPVADKPWWDQPAVEEAPETPVEAVASVDAVVEEPVADKPWWEQPAVEEAPEAPVEAVASVDAVVEEPVADKPWWEQPAVEEVPETPVEAVASVDAVVEEPVTDKAWWEQPPSTTSPKLPSRPSPLSMRSWKSRSLTSHGGNSPPPRKPPRLPLRPLPLSTRSWKSPWLTSHGGNGPPPTSKSSRLPSKPSPPSMRSWKSRSLTSHGGPSPPSSGSPETPFEAVASVDAVVEEPVADKPWWEQPAAEEAPETPAEAVASVDAVAEEPAAEKPWWEQPAVEEVVETPVEAVASVDAVAEEPVAEKPWWEQPAVEEVVETPVEAVASVDAVAEEPVAEKPWWEQPAVEEVPETPVEAVASVDAVVEEPVAEKAWWEQPAVEQVPETPVEAVASVDAVVEVPVAEKAWWEQPAVDEVPETPVEAVASVDAVVEEPVAKATSAFDTGADDDDPWADFVSTPGPSEPTSPTPPPPTLNAGWSTPEPAAARDEDMWAHIAASAEEAARADEEEIDLAASLENQMAAARSQTSEWGTQVDDIEQWEAAPVAPRPSQFVAEEEEDVILAAFERHAATPDQPAAPRESDAVFAELLGDEAADIVAEALDDDAGRQSFIRMSAWAPQRSSQSFDGGWGPQQEVEETLGSAAHVPAFGGSDGAGFAPPSWAMDELEAEEAPAPRGHHKTKTWIREIVETSLLALLVFLSVRASFQNFKVEGSSMNPTLEDGQFLIVNKLVYSEVDMEKLSSFIPFVDAGSDPKKNVFHGPERGDIVVLIDPRDTNTDLIKRVIGLPGETIEIVDGKVYINDLLLEEPYITATWHDTKPKVVIPPGEYFVMGDNRENSLDSRSSQVGLVPKDLIIGKAMVSYWPSSKFGFAPNEEGKLTEAKPVLTTQRVDDD
ncbi:signal peptidase I [Candidatus Amarobacter glycogenicus]|uniref:signal peptidase I n=1 Tax=Candidatus Amarobacter glycogenicus TaxID=3140699 RepID=UPI002A11CC13|nr:signal peptidase I [Dehalococcoidia bacterium]